ncbi:hypothetical protein EG328_005131 [Venturia inaequalis]|uniref:Uncharacterized protein n=1 Tax=Venturia inaequalis TaxID=5025 RepID=A0A8H3YX43_VENIN|nr:hypothetical protein EG328_005131 [Venturia inaequalis]
MPEKILWCEYAVRKAHMKNPLIPGKISCGVCNNKLYEQSEFPPGVEMPGANESATIEIDESPAPAKTSIGVKASRPLPTSFGTPQKAQFVSAGDRQAWKSKIQGKSKEPTDAEADRARMIKGQATTKHKAPLNKQLYQCRVTAYRVDYETDEDGMRYYKSSAHLHGWDHTIFPDDVENMDKLLNLLLSAQVRIKLDYAKKYEPNFTSEIVKNVPHAVNSDVANSSDANTIFMSELAIFPLVKNGTRPQHQVIIAFEKYIDDIEFTRDPDPETPSKKKPRTPASSRVRAPKIKKEKEKEKEKAHIPALKHSKKEPVIKEEPETYIPAKKHGHKRTFSKVDGQKVDGQKVDEQEIDEQQRMDELDKIRDELDEDEDEDLPTLQELAEEAAVGKVKLILRNRPTLNYKE